jgi:hypothetical protein
VDGAVGERRGERAVDHAVLLDERDAVERGARDGHVEMVAAARPVQHVDRPVRERMLEERADRVGCHRR